MFLVRTDMYVNTDGDGSTPFKSQEIFVVNSKSDLATQLSIFRKFVKHYCDIECEIVPMVSTSTCLLSIHVHQFSSSFITVVD